nr:Flp pilus assembly complex ATPase component TadA [Bacteriovoracaceae bacterium]
MSAPVVAVLGGKGGVGKSQFAANFAFAYAQDTRTKTLLLDFDQKAGGDQNIIMGMKSKKSIKELADFSGALDPRSIQLFINTHKLGVSYIGMPTEAVLASQVNADALGKHLKAIGNLFSLTVIDCGSELTPLALKALEYATLIFIVVTPDILAVNQTKKLYSELTTQLFHKDTLQIVLNSYQKNHPVSPEVIAQQMGKPVFSAIPRDDESCVNSLTKSQPIMVAAASSAYARGVLDTVRKITQKNLFKYLQTLSKPQPTAGESKGDIVKRGASWTDIKARIHRSLVEEMDLKKATESKDDPKAQLILKEQTKKIVVELLGKEDAKNILNNREDMNRMVKEILDEALGLGPLEDLLSDKEVSEIMVVGPDKIYFEKAGKIKLSEVTFTSDRQVLNVIERIVAPIGRRIDEKTPYVDARLADGSRVHAIIPPCAIDGCTVTIRKFPDKVLTYKDLVNYGSLTQEMADFLRISVEAHRNIIVSGGTGSGKTTLINVLAGFIPSNERIIT